MANLTMQLVGIYFNKTLDIDLSGNPLTIRQIMDLFRDQTGGSDQLGGFDYMTTSSSNPMFAMRHFFAGGETRSGRQRMAGVYELRETSFADETIGLGWQYYVLDENRNRVSATDPGEGFDNFLDAEFTWAENWQLIWRLVAIAREPLK